jgi:hypothetical protein
LDSGKQREKAGVLIFPREVRRELMAAAVCLLLVGQDLTLGWMRTAYLFDASLEGGGICHTLATEDELKKEGKWAVRGGWTKYVGDEDFFTHYRPEEMQGPGPFREKFKDMEGKKVPVFFFLHLFSGLRRDGDIETCLKKLGAEEGFYVVTESLDLAYGDDLGLSEVVDRVVHLARERKYSGVHNGAPCSTWSRVRFVPGGPPPLRLRSHPWGKPGNTRAEQFHTDEHSTLWRNSMTILEEVGVHGGLVTNEHPKDPGRDPYPSTWNLSRMKMIERKLGMRRVTFPQCLWGMTSQKLTTLSGTVNDLEDFDVYGTGRCRHSFHEPLVGLDEKGRFRTRRAQTYPPEMCEQLAKCFIESWKTGKGNPRWMTMQEIDELERTQDVEPEMGERVPCPEVSGIWDPIERWSETARWTFQKEEHNNVLEMRAGIVSVKIASSDPINWDKRCLMISDSQVAIGVFGKGRSSRLQMNHQARKLAAMMLATGMRFYWRYIRTHRNHADGPSRGFPLGVAPKEEKNEGWKELTAEFYQKTKG